MPSMQVKITVKADGQRIGRKVITRDVVDDGLSTDALVHATHLGVDTLASDLRSKAAV